MLKKDGFVERVMTSVIFSLLQQIPASLLPFPTMPSSRDIYTSLFFGRAEKPAIQYATSPFSQFRTIVPQLS